MADQSERLELRGEVGALIGSRDWSKTQLGPLETWPSSLKTMIGVMLGSRFPMMLGWGPDLLEFYNDAYVPVLGVKHPASLGAPVRVVWSEIWNVVGPLMHSVLSGGPALWREHELLFINSRGFAQETFHTFSQSPVPDDDGKVGGVLLTVQETTEQVQGERQLETLRALAERTGVARTATEACVLGASVLEGADADVPFSLVYLLGDDGTPTLAASSPASLAGRVDLRAAAGGWPFHEALRSGEPVPVDDLARRFGSLPGGRYGVSAREGRRRPVAPRRERSVRLRRLRPRRVARPLRGIPRLPRARRLAAHLGDRARPGLGGGATPRRGHGGARPRQDAVLQQHQPRAPHAADADARPHDGRAPLARADPRGPRPRDRPPQRAPPAKARREPARLRAHRGGTRPRVARAHPPRRPHRGAGPRIRLGDARGRPRVRGQLRAAAAPGPDRSGHVGEDPAEPDLERPEVHLRGEGARVAGRARRARSSSRSPTRASGSPRTSCRTSSIDSTASPARGRARRKGPASGSRWCTSSRACWAATSR